MRVSLASPEAAKAHAAHALPNTLLQDRLEELGFTRGSGTLSEWQKLFTCA